MVCDEVHHVGLGFGILIRPKDRLGLDPVVIEESGGAGGCANLVTGLDEHCSGIQQGNLALCLA